MATLDTCLKNGDWEWWSWLTSARRERIMIELQEYAETTGKPTIKGFNEHLWKKWVLPLMTQRAKKCVNQQLKRRKSLLPPDVSSPQKQRRAVLPPEPTYKPPDPVRRSDHKQLGAGSAAFTHQQDDSDDQGPRRSIIGSMALRRSTFRSSLNVQAVPRQDDSDDQQQQGSRRSTLPVQQAVKQHGQKEVPLGFILRIPKPSFEYRVGDFVVRLDKSMCPKRSQQKNLAFSLFIEVLTEIGPQGKIMTKGQGKKKTEHNKLTIQYVILSPDDTRLHNQTTKVEFVATGNMSDPKVQVQFAPDRFKISTNIGLKTQQGNRTEPFDKIVPGSMLSLNTRTAFVPGDYVFGFRSSGDYVLGQFLSVDGDFFKFDFKGRPKNYTSQLDNLTDDGKVHCNFVRIFPPSAQSQAIRCASQFLKPLMHPPQSYANPKPPVA